MPIVFELVLIKISISVMLVIASAVAYLKWAHTYWQNKNVFFIKPRIPFGNLENPLKTSSYIGLHFKNAYNILKLEGHRHAGIYLITVPKYMAIDREIIRHILQQDFDHFTDRGFYYNEKDDPLSANLFALGGQKWHKIRKRLSPAFTSAKLKMMFETLQQCGLQLRDAMDKINEENHQIDAKEVASCYSIDVIGSCAFGLECNSFQDPTSEFRRQGKQIFNFASAYRRAKTVFAFWWPNLARLLRVKLFDEDSIHFFTNLLETTVKYRRANSVVRNDMLQLLIDYRDEFTDQKNPDISENDPSCMKELVGQLFIFFAAGFETSSTTLGFCLYELAKNADIQQKLRDEIEATLVKSKERITYDSIMDMKYMRQVVDETLRKYPPVSFITRQCTKDYKVPGTETVLDKGIEVIISILGIHHDPEYYPDPDRFDPERFSEDSKQQRPPFSYLPFGEGPRICIGLRFGLMQIKVALTVLLRHYTFSLSEKTKVPIEFDPYSFTLVPKTGIFLNIEKVPI